MTSGRPLYFRTRLVNIRGLEGTLPLLSHLRVTPATKSPGVILNSQRLTRRAEGRMPEVTRD